MDYSMALYGSLLCTVAVCSFVGVYTVPVEDNKTDGDFAPKNHEKQTTPPRTSCCERESKRIIAGYDTSRRPIYLDVGHCRQTCQENSAWFEDNNHGADTKPSCPKSGACIPTRVKVERYSLLDGPVDHEIIEECRCASKPPKCTRQSFKKVYFLNTPYQVEVDVGMCSGRCNNQKSCKPKQNKTITLKGPNGDESVSIIHRCQCAGKCYRLKYIQVYNETYLNETTWQLNTRRKEIDVGMCSGTCSDGKKNRCLRWTKSKPRVCLATLRNRQKQCVPTAFKTHSFTTTNYEERTVLSVKSCGCRRKRSRP